MKAIIASLLIAAPLLTHSQGTIVYRTGAEMVSSFTLIDMNLDGVPEFTFQNQDTGVGPFPSRSYDLTGTSPLTVFPNFAGEFMVNSTLPRQIDWLPRQPILPNPGSSANWTGFTLDMHYLLAAVRIRAGDDWNYGWLRFEKVGEDSIGDIWGLRDGAYNSIPNASINMLQVPEPSTWVMMLGGFVAFALVRCIRGSPDHDRESVGAKAPSPARPFCME